MHTDQRMKWDDSIREGAQRGNTNPAPVTPKPTRLPNARGRLEESRITYKPQQDFSIRVLLDGHLVGTIRRFTNGWQYRPRGAANSGKFFDSLEECKRSLEADSDGQA